MSSLQHVQFGLDRAKDMRVALLCAVPRFHQLQSVPACEDRCVGAKLTIYQLVLQVEFGGGIFSNVVTSLV